MRTSFRQLNRLAPVPMLQMGRSRKRVEILRASRSKTRTRIVTALLSPWSLLSYIITENFSVLHRLVTLSSKAGAIAEFIMWVIFVLLQANFLAISESGNISLTSSVKWSATSNRRLCSATKYANNTSALVTLSGLVENMVVSFGVDSVLLTLGLWALVSACLFRSNLPPWETPRWILHAVHNAYLSPLKLFIIHGNTTSHSCWKLDPYFCFLTDIVRSGECFLLDILNTESQIHNISQWQRSN